MMTGSLSGPLARIKVDEKICLGMIEWEAVREAASWFHLGTRQQNRGNIGTCPNLNRKGYGQCRRLEVQSKETSLAPWSAAWSWGWWQQRREEASLPGKRRAPFPEEEQRSASGTMQPDCRSQQASSSAARRSLPVPTTRSTRCRKTEAWQTCGT